MKDWNKHNKLVRQLLIFTIVCFTCLPGCEFEPHLEYDSGAEKPVPQLPEMTLNFTDSLITIYEKTKFKYLIDPGERVFLKIEVAIDQEQIFKSNQAKGSFLADPAIGRHELTIRVYTNSGSESVLEQLGGEGFVYTYTAIVQREVAPNVAVQIISAENEDGTLNITWERYSGLLFEKYQLYKISNGTGTHLLATYNNIDSTEYADKGYVGGNAKYFVEVHRTDQRKSCSDTLLVADIPVLSISTDNNFQLTISWSQCNYDANFKNYVLTRIENYMANHWSYSEIFTSEEITDTSFTFSYGLDPESTFRLTYNSTVRNEDYGFCNLKRVYNVGFRIDDEGFYTISQSDFEPYWLYTEDFKINPVTFNKYPYAPPERFGTALSVTPDNVFLVAGRNLLDPSDMSRLKKLTGITEDGSYPIGNSRVSVTVKEIVLYEFFWYGRCYLYDIKNDSLIMEFGHSGLHQPTISPNGQYIVAKDRHLDKIYVYEIDGTNIGLTNTIEASSMYFTFLPDTLQSKFISINGNNLELWSCDTRSLVRRSTTDADHVLEIDPVSNTVLCSEDAGGGNGVFHIFSIEPSLSRLNTFSAEGFNWKPDYYRDLVSYVDSTLFIGDGYSTYAFKINH